MRAEIPLAAAVVVRPCYVPCITPAESEPLWVVICHGVCLAVRLKVAVTSGLCMGRFEHDASDLGRRMLSQAYLKLFILIFILGWTKSCRPQPGDKGHRKR